MDKQRLLKLANIPSTLNEGILQDREKQLKNLKQGGTVSGGGYGPFKKTGRDTFTSVKGIKHNSNNLVKLIGGFSDFKVEESVNEVKLNDLVGNQYKYVIGSSEVKYLGKNDKKYVLEMIANSLKHYLYDHDFALNYLDGSQRKQYESFFEKEVLKPMLSKIDFTLNNFFTLDKDKVKWTLSSNDTRKMVDEIFRKNKKIPIDIKREYYEYRLDYAGVKLKESLNEDTKNTFKSFKKDFDNVITHSNAYLEGDKIKIYLDTNPNKEKNIINKLIRTKYSDKLKKARSEDDVMVFKIIERQYESLNERYRPNLESKSWEAAQKVIRQLQSSVFKKLDDDELLEFRKAIASAFNLDGILK